MIPWTSAELTPRERIVAFNAEMLRAAAARLATFAGGWFDLAELRGVREAVQQVIDDHARMEPGMYHAAWRERGCHVVLVFDTDKGHITMLERAQYAERCREGQYDGTNPNLWVAA